jgi:hypothetical protein
MGLFDNILDALGLGGKDKEEAPKASAPKTTPSEAKAAGPHRTGIGGGKADMPMVDVTAKMDALAKANPQELQWRVSIVDMMKLLGMDSSFENRKKLAVELGVPTEYLDDSAQMNMWLHKTVMKKISQNGGEVPANLLD